MNRFFEAFANMFRIPDLRKRILFTLGVTRGLPPRLLHADARHQRRCPRRALSAEPEFRPGLIDLFSGGNFRRLTIFALGIMPYITASIILELMAWLGLTWSACRKRENWAAEDHQYTRYLTIS